jgi:hypothetical protein
MKTFLLQIIKPLLLELLTSEEFIELIKSLLKPSKNVNENKGRKQEN